MAKRKDLSNTKMLMLIGHEKDSDIYETKSGRLYKYKGDTDEKFNDIDYWQLQK